MIFPRFIGRIRLWFGFCPACNSDAPELDTCEVCDGHRWNDKGIPSKAVREVWRVRYLARLKKPLAKPKR